jgi:hypothetical protein
MEKDLSSIQEDFKYQQGEWKIKRVFWVLMGIFLILGILGAFGDSGSLLSTKEEKLSTGTIIYDKFLRVDKSFETKVVVQDISNECSIAFNKDYIHKIQITQVIPEPINVVATKDQLIYYFKSNIGGTITFFNDPSKMGSQKLEMVINGEKAHLSQYIYF